MGADRWIRHTRQTAANNGWTGGWRELSSDADRFRAVRAAANSDGRLEVFAIDDAGHVRHTWQV